MTTPNLHRTTMAHAGDYREAEEYRIPQTQRIVWGWTRSAGWRRLGVADPSDAALRRRASRCSATQVLPAGESPAPSARINWPAALGTDVRGAIKRLRREGGSL